MKKDKRPKYIILIGPQSSGKGSYAGALCEKYGTVHISTGDLLRESIKKGEKLGKKAEKYMNEGSLVPDKLVIKILKNRLIQEDAKKGAIFDGYPRNLNQTKKLIKYIGVSAVVNVQIPDDVVIERCLNRRVCENCGNITKASELKKNQKCECGGKYILREDDKQEAIEKRLATFYEQTMPVVQFFERVVNAEGNKIFVAVDAKPTIPVVIEDIINKLETIFNTTKKDIKEQKKALKTAKVTETKEPEEADLSKETKE